MDINELTHNSYKEQERAKNSLFQGNVAICKVHPVHLNNT